jgi:adenylosuccinate synthase
VNTIVIGLGYGDEGKGSIVDSLCASSSVAATVRFNGGPQAGHRVVTADGRDHVFAQWGSGTFRDVPTFHSRFTALSPTAMTAEADHLTELGISQPYDLLTVDPDCLIITPYHQAWGQEREIARGAERHGSCGMGHGFAIEHSLTHPEEAVRVRDIQSGDVHLKLAQQWRRYHNDFSEDPYAVERFYRMWVDVISVATADHLATLAASGDLVFEGAQGVLLDEWYGFHPYTTWSTTTFANAETLLTEVPGAAPAMKLGVLRALSTRHGPGPFVSEGSWRPLPDEHNTHNQWQGHFRIGYFDAIASAYAVKVAAPDVIALTHLDNADELDQYVRAYRDDAGQLYDRIQPPVDTTDLDKRAVISDVLLRSTPVMGRRTRSWRLTVEDLLGVPVIRQSWGPMWPTDGPVGRVPGPRAHHRRTGLPHLRGRAEDPPGPHRRRRRLRHLRIGETGLGHPQGPDGLRRHRHPGRRHLRRTPHPPP